MRCIRTFGAAIVLVGTLAAGRAWAQTVTLPTIRATKTPEMALLEQMIAYLKTPNGKPKLAVDAKDTTRFACDLATLAITPYTRKELTTAQDAETDSTKKRMELVDSAKKANVAIETLAPRRVSQKLNQVRATSLETVPRKRSDVNVPDGLAAILTAAPASCDLAHEVLEPTIHQIILAYTAVETNAAIKSHLDSLELVARANTIRRDLRERHWFPVKSHDDATAFWRQPSASSLNIGAISGSGDQGATFTELTSRFLHAARLSFNTVIASTKDSSAASASSSKATTKPDTATSSSTVSRFLNGGGLLNLAVAYPMVHFGEANGSADFLGVLAPRFGATLPVLGASQRDTTLMYDAGSEFMFKSADFVDGVGVFIQSRIGVAGGSPKFMGLIGDADKHRTGYQTVTGGISLDDRFLITLSRTVSGPHALQNTGWQIGVSLARSASTPAAVSK